MANLATGGCLCGAVAFRITGAFEHFFLCHCSRCRKDTGSAHAANLFSDTAKLDWISGKDNVRIFRLPGSRHVRCFCTACGSALPFAQGNDGIVVVPAGALDTPVSLRPTAHICMSDRAGWDSDLAAVPQVDGLPG